MMGGTMLEKVLIVYATSHGQTAAIARAIAAAASEGPAVPTVLDARVATGRDLATHTSAVLIASIHYGRHQRSMARFVKRNADRLAKMHTAFISVSGDAIDPATRPRAEQAMREFFRTTGWTPSEWQLAGGAVKFTKYNFLLRYIMKRKLAAEGKHLDPHRDYDYTDWEAVMRFARAFLSDRHVMA
jgi:menaquinone-dependent protoporphyrinogen oxidase